MKSKLFASLTLAWLSILNSQLSTLHAQGTAFTYQGRLWDTSSPPCGLYDLKFTFFGDSAAGSAGGSLTNLAVAFPYAGGPPALPKLIQEV